MKSLDFNNVFLIPRMLSSISSRDDVDISTTFCGRKLTVPLIASPMKDVADGKTVKLMMDNGAFGIIHRFQTIDQQVEQYKLAEGAGCAIGIEEFERTWAIYGVGCRIFCVDCANGANFNIKKTITTLLKETPDIQLIVGNVASKEGFNWLGQFKNVHAIRCGIGGGIGCTTTQATGIYHPTISMIDEINKCRIHKEVSIVVDGGIDEPNKLCKAIAFGADVCMVGSILAASIDSPAEIVEINGKKYKQYSGSASAEIQSSYREPRYVEGTTRYLEFRRSIPEILQRFGDGLRSSLSYMGAKNLIEYRKNLSYCVC